MHSQKQTINTRAILILCAGLVIAFLPTLTRLMGYELILLFPSRIGEALTMLLALIGGIAAGWSVYNWRPQAGTTVRISAILLSTAVTLLAIATNVLSIFAF